VEARPLSCPAIQFHSCIIFEVKLTMDLQQLANQLRDGQITGHTLSEMMKENKLTKTERRKIAKLSSKEETVLTERQKLRLAVKEKKAQPKLTKDDRKRKFGKEFDEEREKEEANFTICLGCRKRGHFVKDCPKYAMVPSQTMEVQGPEVCFNCGSKDHTLKTCPKPREGKGALKFASCFICKKIGHISRDCPENPNGLYPNGGCCHICLLKTHLVRDCPERTEEDKLAAQLRREKAEDEEKGPRIKGLTSEASMKGGDDIVLSEDEQGDDSDDEAPKKAKKNKKDKSEKKKKHSK